MIGLQYPENWNCTRLKNVALVNENSLSTSTHSDYILNYLEISNVNNRGIISKNEIRELFFLDAPSRARRIVRNGDTVISSVRPNLQAIAHIKHISGNLVVSTGFYVVTPIQERLDEKYTYYLLISDGSRQHLEAAAKGVGYPAVDDKDFVALKFAIPSLLEQRRIAAYLDKTCAAIDKAIEAKQKQLEILDALRKSIIHKALTRGLDDSVELKDSGVEWIGGIPRHWDVRRIKDIVALNSGDSITSDNITPSGNYPVFGGNGLRGFTSSYTHDGYYVLIGRQGALCGNINYAEGKFWASEHAVVATTLRKHDTFWFGELLRAMNLNQYSNAAAQPGLAVEKIKFLRLPVPSYEEQHRIALFVKDKIIRNEELLSNLQKQISTLTQYRKSLIHECVTGKRRVNEDHAGKQ